MDLSRFGQDIQDRETVRACTGEIMRAITALVEGLRGEKAPRPFDMHYDGDPGKGRIGVRRPDPLPEVDGRAAGLEVPGGTEQPEVAGENEQ